MAAVKKNQPPTVQNTNETVRDAPKMSYQPVGCGQSVPHSAKIKTARISSEESGRFSVKICTSEISRYTVCYSSILTTGYHVRTQCHIVGTISVLWCQGHGCKLQGSLYGQSRYPLQHRCLYPPSQFSQHFRIITHLSIRTSTFSALILVYIIGITG